MDIHISAVVARDFSDGSAAECGVLGTVHNNTKYRLQGVDFTIRATPFAVGEMHANDHLPSVELSTITRKAGDPSCAAFAQSILDSATSVSIHGCSLDGVAEGDCQKMVSVSVDISAEDVERIAAFEALQVRMDKARRLALVAPLVHALAALPDPHDDNQILDVIVNEDSRSWFANRYDQGSMHGASTISRAADGSSRRIHGLYTFNGGEQGWVNVTLPADLSVTPCVEFWDFAGSCRDLRIPDTVPKPPPPAPVAPPADASPPPTAGDQPPPSDAPAPSEDDQNTPSGDGSKP